MNSTDLTALAPDSLRSTKKAKDAKKLGLNRNHIIEPWRLGDGYKEFFLDAPDSVKGPNNQGHWLVKSIQCVLDILKNADSNAEGCWCLSHCFPPYPFHGSQYIVWWGLQDLGLQQLWGKTTNWVGFRVSVVWEGRHLVDGTVVAIKEIAMTEIFILRKINHPNIIHFIDMIEVRLLFLFPIRLRTSMFPKMSQACLTNFWMVAASEETSSSRGAASLVFVGEKVLLISEQRDWRRSRRQACDDLAAGFG
uniref:Protein kinase domain-containing protein n=1 Tax=Brassica oleracea var. oleracea TaxID=109376 RepID=A0A0D3BPC4_BRAOL